MFSFEWRVWIITGLYFPVILVVSLFVPLFAAAVMDLLKISFDSYLVTEVFMLVSLFNSHFVSKFLVWKLSSEIIVFSIDRECIRRMGALFLSAFMVATFFSVSIFREIPLPPIFTIASLGIVLRNVVQLPLFVFKA